MLFLFIIFLRCGSSCGCISSNDAVQMTGDQYVFIEHTTVKSCRVLEGNAYPMSFITPKYSYDDERKAMRILFSAPEVNDRLIGLYGDGLKGYGDVFTGQTNTIYGVYGTPYDHGHIRITGIEKNGTAHLNINRENVTLKPGEKWSNSTSYIEETDRYGQGTARIEVTIDESIVNKGIWNKQDIDASLF
mgnify:CR=1 FL=1